MRILANYGYRTNGDTYSVTFETMGDVPAAQAQATVDELFRLAKGAVHRQIAVVPAPQPASAEAVTVPQPASSAVEAPKPAAQAAPSNGNGQKPKLKNPQAPATPKQVSLLKRLARQGGHRLGDLGGLTMGEASQMIDELMGSRRF